MLIRFVEFAYTNSEEADQHLALFRLVADIFSIPQEEFDDALAFITGQTSLSLLTISGEEEAEVNHITRKGMEGVTVCSISVASTSIFSPIMGTGRYL
mgnify:CR=1 FL=1